VSPRPQIAHLRRPEILGAAAEVIRERGIQNTRIADVAERIGTSAPAVLYYFESKGELLSQALVAAEEGFYAEFETQLEVRQSARERLVLLVQACLEEGDYDAALWMELWPRALREPDLARTRKELDSRWRATIATIIRQGQANGEFRSADPDDLALVLASLLDGLAIQVTLGDPCVSVGGARRLCLDLLERELDCELAEAALSTAGVAR
jgi:AcrR family transcriptional regulator